MTEHRRESGWDIMGGFLGDPLKNQDVLEEVREPSNGSRRDIPGWQEQMQRP